MPLEANAFGGVRGSPGGGGTRSGARETNPKPEHGRDGRRDFSSRAGREALAGGVTRGGTHHASAAPEQSRAWQRPRARRGRKQQQTSWTARDVRMATAESSHGQKRETWPPLGFRVFFCVSETCRQSPKHENFFQTGMARKSGKSLQRRPSRNAQLESCVPARRLPSGRRFRVARWRCPSPRAKPEGWRRARGEPLRTSVRRRGRVSDAPRVTAPRPPRVSLGRLRASSAPRRRRR